MKTTIWLIVHNKTTLTAEELFDPTSSNESGFNFDQSCQWNLMRQRPDETDEKFCCGEYPHKLTYPGLATKLTSETNKNQYFGRIENDAASITSWAKSAANAISNDRFYTALHVKFIKLFD